MDFRSGLVWISRLLSHLGIYHPIVKSHVSQTELKNMYEVLSNIGN